MKLNVVVLAAGMGKRMRSEQPKVLHTIAGKPMLTHVLDTGRHLHADQLIVVIGHGGERVQAHYGDTQDLAFVWQVPQQGTGDAVKQAIPLLKEAGADDMTLILYGDVPLVQSASLEHLLNECRQHQVCGVLTQNVDDPTGYGRIVRDAQGRIQRIVEQKDANPQELAITEINTGIIAAPTQQLIGWLNRLRNDNAQAEYYLTDVIAMAVAEGQTVASAQPLYEWETKGVNSRTQQAELECIYQTVLAERLLEEGVCLLDKTRIDVRGELQCGQDVRIDVGCVFEGRVVLGNRVTIGPYCVLKDVTIADDTVIEAYSHLVQAQVGSSAKVGPYARLRPGTQLADHTHVGNFVELKNTYLGEGSKANHLTYLGDAQIGSKVNIGAGVITVNYDGVNKFKTIIEDRAFVGSNSSLVAPLTVGQGATVGAGSTLTKDATAEQLTVARARAVTIASWKRPVKKT